MRTSRASRLKVDMGRRGRLSEGALGSAKAYLGRAGALWVGPAAQPWREVVGVVAELAEGETKRQLSGSDSVLRRYQRLQVASSEGYPPYIPTSYYYPLCRLPGQYGDADSDMASNKAMLDTILRLYKRLPPLGTHTAVVRTGATGPGPPCYEISPVLVVL